MGSKIAPMNTQDQRTAVCLADYEDLAGRQMDAASWAYVSGGAGDELTRRWNEESYQRLALIPRVLNGGGGHTRLSLLGREFAHPIFVAPIAHQKLAHPDGEAATAKAATAMDAGMVLSTLSSMAMEDVAKAGAACCWFQLYMQAHRDDTLSVARRAEACGFEALVVTVDAPVGGARNREQRAGFRLPADLRSENLSHLRARSPRQLGEGESAVFQGFMADAPTWDDIAWLKDQTRLPIIVKGVLAADDAERVIAAGCAGLVVSNHGGRTLDTAIATIDALPEIAARVGGRIPILIDGGVRRGTDVLKALALGAEAVLVGRPIVYGLSVAGASGVAHVLKLLRDEFELAMALTGCRSLADIGPHLVGRR